MTTEPDEKTGKGAQEEDSEAERDHPTVTPPFDPVAFAQEVIGGRPSPAAGSPVVTPPAGRKAADIVNEEWPHSRRPAAVHGSGRPTPIGVGRVTFPTLTDPAELEDARVRSIASGRPTPKGLISLANSRVPSNLPPRTEGGVTAPPGGDEWEELATRPPPPQQQELLEAMAQGSDPPATRNAARSPSAAGAASSTPAPATAREMNDRISLGDYSGALEIAERLLAIDPDDEPVNVCAESCRGVLRQMYTTRIGPLDRVPIVMVARDQLRWLSIDHRAGFVLSLVDGVSSFEMILDVSGMPELDALRILSELAQQRIISFR